MVADFRSRGDEYTSKHRDHTYEPGCGSWRRQASSKEWSVVSSVGIFFFHLTGLGFCLFAAASSGLPDSQLHDLETLDHHTYDFFTCERLLCLLLDIAVLEEDFRAELSRSSLVLRLYTCADRNLVTVTHAAHRCFLMDVFIQNPDV